MIPQNNPLDFLKTHNKIGTACTASDKPESKHFAEETPRSASGGAGLSCFLDTGYSLVAPLMGD
jgi:hypothetical protein